jgi:hypothetical protein
MSCRYALSAVSTILFSTFAIAGVPADPLITAPAVLPRQNDAQFIGWVEVSGTCQYPSPVLQFVVLTFGRVL